MQLRLKGEVCIGVASLFSFVALILLIMVNVGQINPGRVPRSISMVNMNVTALGASLQAATGDPSQGLFNSTDWVLGAGRGLEPLYSWGIYAVCGYNLTNGVQGACSTSSLAYPFTPFEVIINDTPPRFNNTVTFFISNANDVDKFINSSYFKTITNVAFYLIFIATIATAVAFFIGIFKTTVTFVLSALLAMISAIFILAASILWSTIIRQAKTINDARSNQGISVGINVQQGNAPYMLWAAFALLVASIVPYTASCCTFRRR
ncbi:hypothetical protein PIIN_04587 [Serendipita indica DSM 11827]|uniref:Uncharacterized protein n=1 Tax=Serendipita indica (strain DSM 11827) TaxID=1109443 RepID=G4TH47_SERID|nr:hypothetical protein PIIN_04587 [Serendipita indica DSM 11827]